MPETLIAGRYRLDTLLGRGGMSEVWGATDLELGRRVAVKLLAPNEDNARFEREARAIAGLAHPNVTQLYDYGESDGRPFMVLEYLPGGSLEELLQTSGALPDDDTRRIATEVAAGLAHAHARGLVHRDLKPSNVLFDDEGRAKLADFGIARMAAGDGTLTEAGTVMGTAAYISPEQASGLPATAASDVYSFGVLLFRMLTGLLPFKGEDPLALIVQHRDEAPPPVASVRPDAPPDLAALTDATLQKDPLARPPDGEALLDALTAGVVAPAVLADGDATRVLPAMPPPRRTRRFGAALAIALLLLLAVAGAVLAYEVTRPSDGPVAPPTVLSVTLKKKHHHSTTTAPTTTTKKAATTTTAPTTTAQAPTTTRHTVTHPVTTTPPPPPTTATFTTTAVTTTTPATTTAPPPTTTAATTTG